MNEKEDIVITRIREVRHRISEQYRHDPQQLITHYLELQQQFTEQLLAVGHIHTVEVCQQACAADVAYAVDVAGHPVHR